MPIMHTLCLIILLSLSSLALAGTDGDGVADAIDNCLSVANADQLDTDSDGEGNVCDDDDDNDGVLDTADAFPLISLGSLTDADGDGRPNACDSDCQALGMAADIDDDSSSGISVNNSLCTTDHCWTVTDSEQTTIWVAITLDDTYIDVPVDANSDSVIDSWESVSIYLEYEGQEYLVSNHDGAAFQMTQAPSNLDKFDQAMQSGSIRVKAGPNFTLTEMLSDYQGARVRLGFATYQGYSVDDMNLDFNQVTIKRPLDGTGNREDGRCAELFVGDVVDLNEREGLSVITKNAFTLASGSLLFGQGFFGRSLFCSDTELLSGTAPIWGIDGRGGKGFVGNVELAIAEERVSAGAVIYSLDSDNDGILDTADAFPLDATESIDTDLDGTGNNADTDDDNDGVLDGSDAFPLDPTETSDMDSDGVGDNADAFPSDAEESIDTDGDQVGDNADNCLNLSNADQLNTDGDIEGNACDLDDDNDGFRDEEELVAGTDPVSASSCPGCFNWDIDDDGEAIALTDGLMMIRHMFGFGGDSLSAGAMGAEAGRATPEAISSHLTGANAELDVDGDGESKALTDGLLLIRYLFGFSGDSLISGAIGNGSERDTAEEVEAYIEARLPPSP